MNIWIVTIGEPLPIDADEPRLLRAGIIAGLLADAGHEVTWWSSNFDHTRKHRRFATDTTHVFRPNLKLILLEGGQYKRNVSLARIRNHRQIARKFAQQSETTSPPDIIFCSFPPIELCREVTCYGRRHRVPVVLDIRDLWPDVMIDLAPKPLRRLAEYALSVMRRDVRRACADATAIVGLTTEYRDWGLAHAGRSATKDDRVFSLAYAAQPPNEASLSAANSFWRSLGIGPRSDGFVVAYFGMMGVHFEAAPIAQAVRLLSKRKLPIKLVLCGEGDARSNLMADTADLDSVLMPGWVNAPQIWSLMRSASLGFAPYIDSDNYRKNIPNKIIEYLSAGLPIVTNLTGVVRELLEKHDCGYFYGHDSGEELAAVLAAAYENPQMLRQRSKNAERLFHGSYSADLVYDELVRWLENIALEHQQEHAPGNQPTPSNRGIACADG